MSLQPLAQVAPEQWGHAVPHLSLVTNRHRAALSELRRVYDDNQPLAVLTGQGKFESNHVLSGFLSSVDKDVTSVRLTKPYPDALEGMREITRSLGFDPKDLSLADLDNILKMFLSFQCKHHRRTILCVEQAHRQGRWLLDQVRRLVELEVAGKFGLMTILSGRPRLNEVLSSTPLEELQDRLGTPITLAPFSLTETTEFLRQRIEATGTSDISELFDFDAITCLHEASEGVPDVVGVLCFKCLELANKRDSGPVSVEIVSEAKQQLKPEPLSEPVASVINFTAHTPLPEPVAKPRERGRLVARRKGELLQVYTLNQGRYLVGRANTADIRLPFAPVSRRHALIIKTAENVKILDLGSTNGCLVNRFQIDGDHELFLGDVISIGDCRIEYVSR